MDVKLTRVSAVPRLSPGPGDATVSVLACGICGSDIHAWRQDKGYEWIRTPVVLGHEIVGVVTAVGQGVDTSWVGRQVVPVSIDGCGRCVTCQAGVRQLCADRTVIGLSSDGGAAEEFIVAADRLVEVPSDVAPEQMVLVEPTSVAVHAVSRLGDLASGAQVVVSGPGPIGLLTAWLLDRRGIEVVVTGTRRDESVRMPAAAKLGLRTVLAEEGELPFLPDYWVEASGSEAGLRQAIESVGRRGTVVIVALFGGLSDLDVNVVVRREIKLVGSYASIRADYDVAARELSREEDLRSALVTVYPLDKAIQALHATAAGEVGKAALVPNPKPHEPP